MLEELIAADWAAELRPCVGLLVLHQGQVLLGRQAGWHEVASWTDKEGLRIDDSVPEWKFALEIPQGGIEKGEDITRAFFREALEEFGPIAAGITDPEFITRTETMFRFERDGTHYRGKTIYYCAVDAGYLGMNIGEWFDTFMDVNSDAKGPAYPTPGFPGGVHLYNHSDAVESLCAHRLGRKTDLMIEVLNDLLRRDLLVERGFSYSAIDIPYYASLLLGDPCSLDNCIQRL